MQIVFKQKILPTIRISFFKVLHLIKNGKVMCLNDVGFLGFYSKITIIQIYLMYFPLNFVFILPTWTGYLYNFSSLLGPIIARTQTR